jgi:hypothetical protein
VFKLHGGGGLVDLLAAGAGALEEVFYEVAVQEGRPRREGLGEEGGGGVESGMLDALVMGARRAMSRVMGAKRGIEDVSRREAIERWHRDSIDAQKLLYGFDDNIATVEPSRNYSGASRESLLQIKWSLNEPSISPVILARLPNFTPYSADPNISAIIFPCAAAVECSILQPSQPSSS